ncbi:hypothetical protein LTR78_005981 [Recurvomyces mirabilis]|uniref:Glucose-methanol-choline oxidoreductase N-terminal domain-containing protein n=1 Tax=Recurvomyces mirabilis TaxID=574656 RepID=A0AAE0WLW4_9PEZI|nr:hypothetical protein LTR78_005981 [Recurvomyces mirabilis]KAK5155208.1 hypothetical protein LTS14_006163 [Recurvomyces mirabilis]
MLSSTAAQLCTAFAAALLLISTPSNAAPTSQCKYASRPCDDINAAYDYIIVGGGPSGLVLANTLSTQCGTNVLLLEAGQDTSGVENVYIPGFAGNNEFSKQTWNYYVTPQKALGGLAPHLAQGFGLGGGTSVNYMNYNRGAKSVFDQWANVSGNSGLAWENLINDFEATTQLKPNAIAPNWDDGQVISATAYGKGPLNLTRALTLDGFDPSFNNALRTVLDLPQVDFNDGTGIGVSYGLELITPDERRRSYAYPAFGVPAAGRSNLHIQHSAYVTKINMIGKKATSVTFADTANGNTKRTVTAKEIILSAGAIATPKLLMLSGIGPADHLKSLNIPVLVDQPAIGSNLYDHNYASIEIEVADSVYTLSEWQNTTYLSDITKEWYDTHTGPLANAPASSFSVLRIPDSAIPGPENEFHRSLPADRGQLQIQYANIALIADTADSATKAMTIWVALVQPEASGTVRLNSTDPFAFPLIDTNYFGSAGDLNAILYGFKRMRDVLASPLLSDLIVREIYPGSHVISDEDIKASIPRGAQSYHHPTGSCALGTVLDSGFRVKGVQGLRVVDASVFPYPTNVHQQAQVYAVAHMAARQIAAADGRGGS